MERPALFLSSLWLLALISCSDAKEKTRLVDQRKVSVKHSGGVAYVNDSIFTGTLFSLYPDLKDTLEFSSFVNGREHGICRQFYPNGVLKEVRYFKNGKKQGEYKGWWEDRSKKFVFQFADDEYNGTCYEWADNGQLIHEANYIAGHEAGEQRAWYTNGKVRSNYTIINGRRYGLLGTKNCKNVSDSVFRKR
jgi:antitoxin component YwqK of YwqJK toxin-antitoxin module